MSKKIDQAFAIYTEFNSKLNRKELVNLISYELKVSAANASTYYYKCVKMVDAAEPVEAMKIVSEVVAAPVVAKKKRTITPPDFPIPAFLLKSAEHWDKFGYAKF